MIKVCFSPANGILLVERPVDITKTGLVSCSFSPANGILLVERQTKMNLDKRLTVVLLCFSPANGILLVESNFGDVVYDFNFEFQSRERDSIS